MAETLDTKICSVGMLRRKHCKKGHQYSGMVAGVPMPLTRHAESHGKTEDEGKPGKLSHICAGKGRGEAREQTDRWGLLGRVEC